MDTIHLAGVILWTSQCFSVMQIRVSGSCQSRWFGPSCQFQCHCSGNDRCTADGQCSGKCAKGWFGLKCQFADLATVRDCFVITMPSSKSISWLTDGDDTTCNTDPCVQAIKLTWSQDYWIRSIRLTVNDTDQLMNFEIHCSNPTTIARLDNRTIEYMCDMSSNESLLVTGPGLLSLCSLYVNGGRNVALKQKAHQTNNYHTHLAHLAVDGDRISNLTTCTHTSVNDPAPPTWTLEMDSPKTVYQIVLYNREDCCQERLRNFHLKAMNITDALIFQYNDTSVGNKLRYDVQFALREPISKLTITATPKAESQYKYAILTLCEVEIFGECAMGTWGLLCDKTCPELCRNVSCHQEAGECFDSFGHCDLHNSNGGKVQLTFDTGLGIGVAIGVVLIIILEIVAAVFLYKRWQQNRRLCLSDKPYDSLHKSDSEISHYKTLQFQTLQFKRLLKNDIMTELRSDETRSSAAERESQTSYEPMSSLATQSPTQLSKHISVCKNDYRTSSLYANM
ncbi:fucolectin-1 [Biomphalaria pfeifferi]|uniref:Fucolectin-1 n=1 Tax=Biomphalaria pfeifferi TaxID=112525 RepID=A0AAD8FNR2_BIOPF|nr:fucolectin-1 [Biomphalaria pfeifferi]